MKVLDRLRSLLGRPTSSDYRIVETVTATDGWREPEVSRRQHAAWTKLLREMHAGSPRSDLFVAVAALRDTALAEPSVIEIGCGSGYYSEILKFLFGPIRYVGIDYSAAMIGRARESWPNERFLIADATHLPFRDRSFDVGFSGNSLMHIPDYRAAIAETARVSAQWCVFHSVPVMEHRATTLLCKKAYGTDVYETVFNRAELESLFAEAGLVIHAVRDSIAYDVGSYLGDRTREVTYTCARP